MSKNPALRCEDGALTEWLIADGLGGYAMGTSNGMRTRRYHSLLLVAAPDSEKRYVLVNGVEAWLETTGTLSRKVPLNTHRYAGDTNHPERVAQISKFSATPWPSWTLEWPHGLIEHSISGVHGNAATVLRWYWGGKGTAKLRVRVQLSGRDWHMLHRENSSFRFDSAPVHQWGRQFAPYDGVPPVVVYANAEHRAAPLWFRNFQLEDEKARGQEYLEDAASPGEFVFDLSPSAREAVMVLTTAPEWGGIEIPADVRAEAKTLRENEQARIAAFTSPAHHLADKFVVTRGKRRTIIAGYPWFTDWGRDTFIAVRGLCIASGRKSDAEAILLSWCEHLSQGMMPNLFPSDGSEPRYNSVDASLWFIVAVQELTDAPVRNVPLPFLKAVEDILTHYSRGTRHGIRLDSDGLLAAGEPGVALTWMDAVVDGTPVTPRVGKPVEVQALWINALEFASTWNKRWASVAMRARESFEKRFWNEKRQCLYDVVDVDHVPGTVDDRIRPNQLFAIAGLPSRVLKGDKAAAVFVTVARDLVVTSGVRTLAPGEPGYIGKSDGALWERDLAYHQGTVWPWLASTYMEALTFDDIVFALARDLLKTGTSPSPNVALTRPWEIADGDAPNTPRGCPFQAWSVGEGFRLRRRAETAIAELELSKDSA